MEPTRLLIADDDTVACEMLEIILSGKYPGLLIFTAHNGRIAMDSFREHLPDIVISDVMMPELDGLELAREIKTLKPDTKLVIISGLSDMAAFDELEDAGIVIDYRITKPVVFENLYDALDRCLSAVHRD